MANIIVIVINEDYFDGLFLFLAHLAIGHVSFCHG
jgi:hypothetical protein